MATSRTTTHEEEPPQPPAVAAARRPRRRTPVQATGLMEIRRRASYTAAERRFSQLLQERLQELLQGRRNGLELLRKYPAQPDRLGVTSPPRDLPRQQLRLPVVEKLVCDVLEFVSEDAVGGRVGQTAQPDGSIVETQTFSTRYPHIVIVRTDRYVGSAAEPAEITWCLQRVQNQHSEIRLNRLLDAAALVFEAMRAVR